MKTQQPKIFCKSSSKRELYTNASLSEKQETFQINTITLHLKELQQGEQTKPKVSRRHHKDQSKINGIETENNNNRKDQ